MKNYNVIGVMSGTSLDGVDIVYVKFTQNESWSFKIINSKTYKYEDSTAEILNEISRKSLKEIKEIDVVKENDPDPERTIAHMVDRKIRLWFRTSGGLGY